MEAIFSIGLVVIVMFHAGLYARAAYVRRHYMMPRVMAYLERQDALDAQKSLAKDAFIDALSLRLPLDHLKIQKLLTSKEDEDFNAIAQEVMSSPWEDNEALEELEEILSLMIDINNKFNFILWMFVVIQVSRLRTEAITKSASISYLSMKHQH